MLFNINIVKLIEKHPSLKKSSVTLNFFERFFKDIKEICKESEFM